MIWLAFALLLHVAVVIAFDARLLWARRYSSGKGVQWCVWRWSEAQEPYLLRLFVFKTPWGAWCLNLIKEPDQGHPHDHTSNFFSVMWRGWYIERRVIRRRDGTKRLDKIIKRSWFNYMRGSDLDAHRILEVAKGGALTSCWLGPKVREWYYHLENGERVHWGDYKP